MVARHLPIEHKFVCFTDKAINGIECRTLPSDLPGWWAKIGLLRPGICSGENLYLDLDIVVRGDLSIFRRSDAGKVWALDDFSYSLRTPRVCVGGELEQLLGGKGTCNSSVMYWHGDAGRAAWESFTPEVMSVLHGDQNHLTRALYPHGLELYEPGLACSYKYHVINERRTFGSVVVFHGDPKPVDLDVRDPLRMMWEAA
jgi:hypothetical protein